MRPAHPRHASSHSAYDALPDSRLIVLDRGTHLAFDAHPGAGATQEEARVFLAANAAHEAGSHEAGTLWAASRTRQ